MKGNKIAKRYAVALFGIAKSDAELEKIKADIDKVSQICENRDFRAVLNSPVIKPVVKRNIFKEIFEGSVSQNTFAYLNMLIDNHREGMLMDICYSFYELFDKHKNIMNVYVTSAVKLDESEKQKIVNLVKEATKWDVKLNETVNESILGGFILRYEDTQIDSSVSSQLQKIKQQLTQRIQ
ncbi:MAG: ATP synthase F1 subunit delta [Bacteroidia bacterium]|nr:ATP synthase F1 subunit delta [Bacteroidia bacterium]MCZ2249348.1 ATP synthase F1 subunit delta [Bacteroidia bacterium]